MEFLPNRLKNLEYFDQSQNWMMLRIVWLKTLVRCTGRPKTLLTQDNGLTFHELTIRVRHISKLISDWFLVEFWPNDVRS